MRLGQFSDKLKIYGYEKGECLFFHGNKSVRQLNSPALCYIDFNPRPPHARYHILANIYTYVVIRGDALFYSAGNEIKIVATVAIRRIGGT